MSVQLRVTCRQGTENILGMQMGVGGLEHSPFCAVGEKSFSDPTSEACEGRERDITA